MGRLTGKGPIIAIAAMAAITMFAVVALLMNIAERKQEARQPFVRVVEITEDTIDPEVWGQNFPHQYDSYSRTVDMERTRFGGSEAVPREPSKGDPRGQTAQNKLDVLPQLKRLWAGYAFAVDFREERGHAYMLEDQTFTQRQQASPQPGACLNCHSSVFAAFKSLGNGDVKAGFDALNRMSYEEAASHVSHPISCIDCHDSQTMALRVTRPAFMEGIRRLKATQGVENFDVNTMATRQEMRSYVCAQCHVEYYFKGDEKTLTYPWHKGTKIENILEYYDEVGHKDWTHAETGAPMLKAQHPEFELWSQGTHAKAGVSCADCHMPYQRVGAMKVSDHHVRSPLLNINNACQTCHKRPEQELLNWAESIQERHVELSELALNAIVALIEDIKAAKQAGATEEQLAPALDFQRKASFYVDFAEAENSAGFHADQEAARIFAKAIDFARQGQASLGTWKSATEEASADAAPAGTEKPEDPKATQDSKSEMEAETPQEATPTEEAGNAPTAEAKKPVEASHGT